ncbi:MAG TPA: nucleotidyl transferase AbiEii/AbiGii toxin family protein [Alphaproteobacteria bacterium]|nr:nucleotidyl transferase AbiEii/AbiGii toxin family protein [Alphaproteobacteria bacterium]
MIPKLHIDSWRTFAPWRIDAQVEQDLIISRALINIFSDPYLQVKLGFRGGTALQKLFFTPAVRYSEDIDLVQLDQEPIGNIMTRLRHTLDPWLGKPKYKQGQGRVTFLYRFESETPPITPLKLKIEINTREHFSVLDLKMHDFSVDSLWFKGETKIHVYQIEELLGTKLRALYQRRKGRDLFDLVASQNSSLLLNWDQIIKCFNFYMEKEGKRITRAEFEENMHYKLQDPFFLNDITPILSTNLPERYNPVVGAQLLKTNVFPRLSGEAWKMPEALEKPSQALPDFEITEKSA